MDTLKEVLVLSDSDNQNTNCNIYDLTTGALISTCKGGNSVQRGLSFISDDCLISAIAGQPKLKVWTLSNYSEDYIMDTGALIEVLDVSNCGTYCAGGCVLHTGPAVFIWEVRSGAIVATLQYHAKPVSCLRFSSEGSHLVSGGKDGIVYTWLISEVISAADFNDPKPRFTWNDHSQVVTDIFVGSLGIFARVATASQDMTCKIYELETGLLLTTVCVDYAITSVVMDECQYFLFLGSAEGDIYRINLFTSAEPELHYDSIDKKCAFIGHSGEITGLSISATGKHLASGSKDGDARIWDISNFTCVKKIPCSGPVTNVFINIMPPGLKEETRFAPRLCSLKKFEPVNKANSDDPNSECGVRIQSRNLSLFHLGAPDDYFCSRILNSTSESLEAMMRSQLSIEDMSKINTAIYSAALSETIVDEEEEEEERYGSPIDEDEEDESGSESGE